MEIYKEERFVVAKQESQETAKTCMVACLWSFLVSITGGLTLGFWEYQYHPTNRQLWMVPFSLILLVTPVVVWFAVFVSDIFNNKIEDVSIASQKVRSLGDSVHDPEK
ncbi:hypothetical protein ACOSP7_000753 [Xanthoceras sorbifolium]